ncbi:MAG: flagellar type III secretion system pore protein FliP [Phycisphaerales bacterium]
MPREFRPWFVALVALLSLQCFPSFASAQALVGPPAAAAGSIPASLQSMNPVSVLETAANSVPGFEGGLTGALNIMIVLTVLSLAPAIMMMCTCFVRFLIVLALLKQALGTQSLPPAQVTLALALFMTFLVMAPTFERVHAEAIVPYQSGQLADAGQVWEKAKQPMRDFMFAQIDAADNWSSVYMVMNYRGQDTSEPEKLTRADVDMLTLIPAFMISELKTAFLLGFRIYLPFLVIDLVISCLLISMSMMMLPPVLISLPFKILLFVLVDGWQLIVGGLMESVAKVDGPAVTAWLAPLLPPLLPAAHSAAALV